MRRYWRLILVAFAASFGIGELAFANSPGSQEPRLSSAPKTLAADDTPTEAKSESAKGSADSEKPNSEKKDKKSDSETADKTASKDEKPASKDAEKSTAEDSKKKDKGKESGDAKDSASKADSKSDDKAAKPEEKKRKTYKVEPKRLKIDLPLEGTFIADKMSEVALRPDSWSDYEIVEVADLGAKVHKGQVLIKFDATDINEAISDLELDQRINELAIAKLEEELPRTEKTLKMDFETADRADREAREDFKRYNEIDRPMMVKTAEFMVKYYNFNLDYEKDELAQLEKMYKADDLTEETEEIVLKRQKNAVEFATFSLDNAKLNSEEMLHVRMPRMDVQIKESLERTALAKARAQLALSLDLNRARYELEQRKKARTKSLDKHAKLLGDRELMEIKSPADGVVYYGQCVNGRFAETASLVTKYQPHNNVTGGSILMTIVEPRPLSITSTLEEGKRPEVSDGLKAKITLPAEGSERIDGKIKSISPIPVSSGKFEINFDVDQDAIPAWIVAGMSCKLNVTTSDKAETIVVPKKAVHNDEYDADVHYVWIVDADDAAAKPERRNVKLGQRKEDEIEIVQGLKKGDVISLDDEDEKKKEKAKEE